MKQMVWFCTLLIGVIIGSAVLVNKYQKKEEPTPPPAAPLVSQAAAKPPWQPKMEEYAMFEAGCVYTWAYLNSGARTNLGGLIAQSWQVHTQSLDKIYNRK